MKKTIACLETYRLVGVQGSSQRIVHRPFTNEQRLLLPYEPTLTKLSVLERLAQLKRGDADIYATVLEGAIRSSVNGAPVKVYHAGENWYEEPGAHHGVSANASKTKPARILAVFVVDSNEKNLTTFVK